MYLSAGKIWFATTITLLGVMAGCLEPANRKEVTVKTIGIDAPVAERIDHVSTYHGEDIHDPYYWLRGREDSKVIAYLEAENGFTKQAMKSAETLQKSLFTEMIGRIKETDDTVPQKQDDYYYYSRTEEGREYRLYCRKHGSLEAEEEILLDLNVLAEGHDYYRLGSFAISPDHSMLAYGADDNGSENYTIRIKNLKTGEMFADRIEGAYYSLEWANDNRTLFYNTFDAAHRPDKLWRHTLGDTQAQDRLVYHEPDESFFLSLSKTRSDRYLMLSLGSQVTSDVHFLDADDPSGEFQALTPRIHGVEFEAAHQGDHFWLLSNQDAVNFKLLKVPLDDLRPEAWQEVLPHREEVMLEEIDAFEGHLVLTERVDGLLKLRVFEMPTMNDHYVAFPEPVYTVGTTGNSEYATRSLRFAYESMVTPDSVFDYDMQSRERRLRKQDQVLGGYDPAQYVSERIWATADDGVRVPMSVVYRKGLTKTGDAPAMLYGYGSYGITTDASFSSTRLSLLDRGFVYAIAHIRGSGDLGRPWYENGKLMKKMNTFTDFIACAEHLVKEKYTRPASLSIRGGSAGGLLMGAVVNMRPELFGAVVAKVPFVDVMNTMMDASLPLTVVEREEWGDPNEKEAYDYMRKYSPYENVREVAYPHMLLTAGLNDPRVTYWEPAKWAARLRVMNRSDNLILLKTNMGAGHGGASGRYQAIEELAFDYAFVLHVLGL
jgi:oligopeptidase B